jgi:hypothetical protein
LAFRSAQTQIINYADSTWLQSPSDRLTAAAAFVGSGRSFPLTIALQERNFLDRRDVAADGREDEEGIGGVDIKGRLARDSSLRAFMLPDIVL